ncbi:MAG: hypothetical protein ACREQH_15520 [Candidatus Binatus sp.]
MTTPQTANPAWGFFGTIRYHAEPADAWNQALSAIAVATGCPAAAVRDFLDSRHGRHFADEVADELGRGLLLDAAIKAAAARWLDWWISRKTERDTGIPCGLPYLTGFVTHFEIQAESAG